jgi:DNA-binding LacI/PurR family transcriptional regulator
MKPTSFTIRDVAALAKVSQGTVSKIINDTPGVSVETRRRVLRLIKDLDYRPNAAAQGLAARRTHSIGVILPHNGHHSLAIAHWPALLRAITDHAAAANFSVLLTMAPEEEEEEPDPAHGSLPKCRNVDGVLTDAGHLSRRQLAEFLRRGFPFVVIGRGPASSHYFVDIDNAGGAAEMTRHLVDLGHRRIAILASPQYLPSILDRVEGYKAAMVTAGLEPRVLYCPDHAPNASECIMRLLRELHPPTALLAGADGLTAIAVRVMCELGVAIPSDVALVAFDDQPFYEYCSPAITAVSQPIHALGRAAAEMLFALMDGRQPQKSGCILPTTLVIRQSCGTPR